MLAGSGEAQAILGSGELADRFPGQQVTAFQRIVREEYGVFCTVRQEMGQDISGAHCRGLAVTGFADLCTLRLLHERSS